MYSIQTLNKISSIGLDLLDRDKYEVASEISNPSAILLRSFKMHDMEISDSVQAVARAGAGVNNIPLDKCTERGIVVFNTPGANANSVKELVLTAMLISSRKVVEAINWVQTQKDKGDEIPKLVEKEKSKFAGPELAGKKLGVVGLGAIGVQVANAAVALGMEVQGYDPFISVDAAWGLSRDVSRATSIDRLSDCDYITMHIPLTDQTRGMLNKEKFTNMKPGMRIMNFARGGLVNNDDLKVAIKEGQVACYVTDFPDSDLVGVDGVLPIPHLGASTPEAEDNCAIMAVNQMKDFLERGNIKNSVNFPYCSLEYKGKPRLVIANQNVPDMLRQILAVLGDEGINIEDMVNKHRDDIAYNIIDLSENPTSDSYIEAIRGIDGVIMARLILN